MYWCIRGQGGSGDEGSIAGVVEGIVKCIGVLVARVDQATKFRRGVIVGMVKCIGVFVAGADQATKLWRGAIAGIAKCIGVFVDPVCSLLLWLFDSARRLRSGLWLSLPLFSRICMNSHVSLSTAARLSVY